jgi:hypothetical protein
MAFATYPEPIAYEQHTPPSAIDLLRPHHIRRIRKIPITDWNKVDSHLEKLGDLFALGKKTTVIIELVYKDVTKDRAVTKGRKKKQSATHAQKAQLAAEAGLWTRVYKHHRCRGKYCKQGPHCVADEQGNHHKLEARHLEDIYNAIREKMKEREKEDEVDVSVEIPSKILQDVLNQSRKRKADSSSECRPCKDHCKHGCASQSPSQDLIILGDRAQRLEEYGSWTEAQTESDEWRTDIKAGNCFAVSQRFELNSVLQNPPTVVSFMVKGGVKAGVALQFMNKKNIEKWWEKAQNGTR